MSTEQQTEARRSNPGTRHTSSDFEPPRYTLTDAGRDALAEADAPIPYALAADARCVRGSR